MSEDQGRLAPTSWRAFVRGFATTMAFSWRADPLMFCVLLTAEVLRAVVALLATYAFKLLTDAAVGGDTTGALLAVGLIAGGRAITGLLGRLYVNDSIKLEEKAQALLDQRLMVLVGALPSIEHHERPDYVRELDLLRDDRRLLGQMANATVLNMRFVIPLVGGTLLLASLDPLLLLLPLFGLPSLLLGNKANRIVQQIQEANAERMRTLVHIFERSTRAESGKELRLFGLGDELVSRHRSLATELMRQRDRAAWQSLILRQIGFVVFASGYVAAVALVLWRAFEGQATAGDVVLAATLASQMNANVSQAVFFGNYLHRALQQTARFLWLRDYADEVSRRLTPGQSTPVPMRLAQGISLENVSFTYPGTSVEVLRDVSLRLPAGAVVALVGENGAGKTTLVKLLSRFYEPTAGRVLADRTDIRSFDPAAWQARQTTAFQDFSQFEFLVMESVGVGDLPSVDSSRAVEAAMVRAGAEAVTPALPDGLMTQLGRTWPDGVDISGGQWQQLALARAFMRRDPLLVIFDEPTAAIDAPTEHALFERLAEAARQGVGQGPVTLIISHRFSTVRMADLIVVLHGGSVRETGTHAELMQQDGLYAELYSLQARAYH